MKNKGKKSFWSEHLLFLNQTQEVQGQHGQLQQSWFIPLLILERTSESLLMQPAKATPTNPSEWTLQDRQTHLSVLNSPLKGLLGI